MAVSRTPRYLGRAVVVGLLAVLLVGAVAVQYRGRQVDGGPVHGEGEGLLSASSGHGFVSVFAPHRAGWFGTFGALLLCVTEPGVPLRLLGVDTATGPAPVAIRHQVRVVPPEPGRTTSPRDWDPIGSALGRFPRLGLPLAGGTLAPVTGHVVEQPCGEEPGQGYTELLTELRVDARGGAVRSTSVHYLARGRRHTLLVPWRMVACGSQTPPGDCADAPSAGQGRGSRTATTYASLGVPSS